MDRGAWQATVHKVHIDILSHIDLSHSLCSTGSFCQSPVSCQWELCTCGCIFLCLWKKWVPHLPTLPSWSLFKSFYFLHFCSLILFMKIINGVWASLVAQLIKNQPTMWETWVRSLGWEDPLEKGRVTHSSILAWRIPWTV